MSPFCIATIGAILGIIIGLYLLKSIAFLIIIFIFLLLILSYLFAKQYTKIICIFVICFSLFYSYTTFLEKNYEMINQTYDKQEVNIKAIIVSDGEEKEYKDVYQIKVTEIDFKNVEFKMILNVKREKNVSLKLEYGDEISFTSIYEKPYKARNKGGFDYSKYLKTKKVAGITDIKISQISVLEKNKESFINTVIHKIRKSMVENVKSILSEDTANLCTGLLLGEKKEISEEIQENFRNSNLSHILAISGAHVSYIILGVNAIIKKIKIHKKLGNLFLITFLIFFMYLVGFTPSVTRACIMAILELVANIIFRKSDTYQNLAISSFIILSINPYALLDIGFQLSFGGTIGIVFLEKRLASKEKKNASKNLKEYEKENKVSYVKVEIQKIMSKIKEISIVTISANLVIFPIILYHFNTFSFTFLISNLLASPILGISIILSIIFIINLLIFQPLAKVISFLLQPILQLLIIIAKYSSMIPFSQILVSTPKIWQIIFYYFILLILFSKKFKERKRLKRSILILFILIIISPYIFKLFPSNNLNISFIDVGQGDSILIQTQNRKNILIDGGGSETGSFNVGEKTLLPYLLDNGILQIDYMIFSHFDSDHCRADYYI